MEEKTPGELRMVASYSNKEDDLDSQISALENDLDISQEDIIPPPSPEEEDKKGQEYVKRTKESSAAYDALPMKVKGVVGLAKGTVKFFENALNTFVDVGNAADDFFASHGIGKDDKDWEKFDFAPAQPENPVEAAGYIAGKYLTGFAGSGVALKAAGVAGKALTIGSIGTGAAASAITQQKEDALLGDIAQSYPRIAAFIPEWLTSKEDDTALEKKGKALVESVFVDTATLGMGKAAGAVWKGFKNAKAARLLRKAENIQETVLSKAAEVEATAKAAPAAADTVGNVKPIRPDIEVPKRVLTPDETATVSKAKELFSMPSEEMLKSLEKEGFSGKNFIENIDVSKDPGLEKAWNELKNGVVDIESAQATAKEIYADKARMSKLLNRSARTVVQPEEMLALGMELEASGRVAHEAVKLFKKSGGKAEQLFMMNAIAKFRHTGASVLGGVSEFGRGQRFYQEAFQMGDDISKIDFIDEAIRLMGDDPHDLANFLDKAMSASSATKVAKDLQRGGLLAKASDVVYETWINALLSRPGTHIKNFIGNTSMLVAAPPKALLAAGSSKVHDLFGLSNETKVHDLFGLSNETKVYGREAAEIMHGYWAAKGEALTTAWSIIKGEKPPANISVKIPEMMERQIGGALGSVINAPGKALMAADAAFKVLNYRGRLHQTIARELMDQGIAVGSSKWNTRYAAMLKDTPKNISLAANKYAAKQTFTAPLKEIPLGELGDGVIKLMNQLPMGRVTTPFVRIGTALGSATLEHLPVIGAVSPKIRAELLAGGARRHEAISKMLLGGSFLGLGAVAASNGLATGAGPRDYAGMRALKDGKKGYMPDSFVVNGNYINANMTPPFSQIFFMGADFAEALSVLGNDEGDSADDLLAPALAILADRLTPEFFTEGVPLYMEFIQKVQEQGLSGDKLQKAASTFIATAMGKPFMETLLKRNIDIIKRDTSPEEQAKSIGEYIRNTFEEAKNQWLDSIGMGRDMPAQKNIFGEDIVLPAAMGPDSMSPFFTTKEEMDPLRQKLYELGIHSKLFNPTIEPGENQLNLRMPERVVKYSGTPVHLSPKEYNKFVMLAAGHHKAFNGVTLEKALTEITTNKEILALPQPLQDNTMKRAITKTISGYRAAARGLMMQNNDILSKFKDALNDRMIKSGTPLSPDDLKNISSEDVPLEE